MTESANIECTFSTERAALAAWQDLINRGIAVSLLSYDPSRELYVFDRIGE